MTSNHTLSTWQIHLAGIKGRDLAGALGVDESVASRIKSGERGAPLERIPEILALPSARYPQGLRLVPHEGGALVAAEELAALKTLAARYLEGQAA